MTTPTSSNLLDLDSAHQRERLRTIASVNSGTDNLAGIETVREHVLSWLSPLADDVELREVEPRVMIDARGGQVAALTAPVSIVRFRPAASRRVLLAAHLDTVFPIDSAFQTISEDGDRWNGPGVADMKGGIVVMTAALEAITSQLPADFGWTVALTGDEEVGSPSSTPVLHELATAHDVGVCVEPSLPDGSLAGERGGSANFDLVIRGKSAHVGRNYNDGRSAIHCAAEAVGVLASLNAAEGVTVNVGKIDGGGPSNQVADLAVVRMNVRVANAERQEAIMNDLRRMEVVLNRRDGFKASLHGKFFSVPKPLRGGTATLFDHARVAAADVGIDLKWNTTGGVCDGNKLQAVGLPTIDTLGIVGGHLHSPHEFADVSSIAPRASLMATLMLGLASGRFDWPQRLPSQLSGDA